MSKKILASLGGSLIMAGTAFAQSAGFWSNPQRGEVPDVATQQTLGQGITGIINFFLGILGLIAVAFLIYAGVLMVTAGGNEDQVGKAKTIITYAVVGLIIIILAYSIVQFVISVLG